MSIVYLLNEGVKFVLIADLRVSFVGAALALWWMIVRHVEKSCLQLYGSIEHQLYSSHPESIVVAEVSSPLGEETFGASIFRVTIDVKIKLLLLCETDKGFHPSSVSSSVLNRRVTILGIYFLCLQY